MQYRVSTLLSSSETLEIWQGKQEEESVSTLLSSSETTIREIEE